MPRPPDTFPMAFPAFTGKAPTGLDELTLAETLDGTATRPQQVTAALVASFEHVGGEQMNMDLARRLAAGTREWLLQQAALQWSPGQEWFEARCASCGTRYDSQIQLRAAPVYPPGPDFPIVKVPTSLGELTFELPNGGHEEVASQRACVEPVRDLVGLCGLDAGWPELTDKLSEEDLEAIDHAFDEQAPDVADLLQTRCPGCGTANSARLDPLRWAFPDANALIREVHWLASSYRWRETDILAMPRQRRRRYVELIVSADRPSRPREVFA